MTKEIERAKQARRSLAIALDRLQHPSVQSWSVSAKELNSAIQSLSDIETGVKSGLSGTARALLEEEISEIRREIARVHALFTAAGRFYQGIAALMQGGEEAASCYTARGAPAPVVAIDDRSKVVVHG